MNKEYSERQPINNCELNQYPQTQTLPLWDSEGNINCSERPKVDNDILTPNEVEGERRIVETTESLYHIDANLKKGSNMYNDEVIGIEDNTPPIEQLQTQEEGIDVDNIPITSKPCTFEELLKKNLENEEEVFGKNRMSTNSKKRDDSVKTQKRWEILQYSPTNKEKLMIKK